MLCVVGASNSPFICACAAFFRALLSLPRCLIYQTAAPSPPSACSHCNRSTCFMKGWHEYSLETYVHVNIHDLPDYAVLLLLLLPKSRCKLASSRLHLFSACSFFHRQDSSSAGSDPHGGDVRRTKAGARGRERVDTPGRVGDGGITV